jgi:hypothetical protein
MVDISQKGRKNLQKKGQAMPASSKNESDAPRFPIGGRGPGPGTLAAAISAVGRARPNTPAERAKVRRYIIRVAASKGWSSDIPDNWNSDGTLKSGGS